jgi:hypothetical protein
MKKAGVVFVVLAIAVVAGLAIFAGASPTSAASDFLLALQSKDVDRLTELSYVPDGHKEELRKQWEFTTKTATPYYRFAWAVQHSKQISDEQAVVVVRIVKNSDNESSYDEQFELPMVKADGQWRVDVYRLSRTIHPALPRMGLQSK